MAAKGDVTGCDKKEGIPTGLHRCVTFNDLWPEVPRPLSTVDGAMFPIDADWLRKIRQRDMSETDFMVCGYPKSGTIWMMEIMSVLSRDGDVSESYKEPVHVRIPFLDIAEPGGPERKTSSKPIVMSHLWPRMLPDQIWQKPVKVVFVLRDPKSVVVSGYHFFQHVPNIIGPFRGTWDKYFEYALSKSAIYGSWFTYIEQWWPYLNRNNVHIVTYEGLSRDLEGNIDKIAKFMNKQLGKTTIAAIAEHVKFENMKANPMTSLVESGFCDTPMQRKGTVDDWKNYFTVAQRERFDKMYSQRFPKESEIGRFLNAHIFSR